MGKEFEGRLIFHTNIISLREAALRADRERKCLEFVIGVMKELFLPPVVSLTAALQRLQWRPTPADPRGHGELQRGGAHLPC